MNCPACQSELRITERQGIEIDYCPKCRGVWLDRGELDKIIERAAVEEARYAAAANAVPPAAPVHPTAAPPPPYHQQPPRHAAHGPDDSHYGYPYKQYKYKKRKSWLRDLLDFD